MASTSSAKQHCPKFSLAEIKSATKNFSCEIIGEGGFGKVYKCSIDNGETIVAMKRRNEGSKQGWPEFEKEIVTLTKIRHRNIVSLIGYCEEEGEMILVYEYVGNQTLADHLHKLPNNGRPPLTWHQRLGILIGAGLGLHYLHDGFHGGSIIHRDVKSSNILLDESFEAKVSDFGLAKHISLDKSHVSTDVKGTPWYIDPYYYNSGGKLTISSDTRAFGLVVLEVLNGRRARDIGSPQQEREIQESNVRENISLKICYDLVERCLHPEPTKRPKMSEVLVHLHSALDGLPTPPHILSGSIQEGHINRVESNRPLEDIEENALELEQAVDMPPLQAEIHVRAISLVDLKNMTEEFDSKYWIANGSRGSILCHGVLRRTGQVAAIKYWPHIRLPDKEFQAQVSKLSRLDHENVVKLLGFCVDDDTQIIVSEFASGGSLKDILYGRFYFDGRYLEPGPALSWTQRIKIAVEVAKGLCYIHRRGLIHRNIKASNVLLFHGETAKITDLLLSTPCSCMLSRDRPPNRRIPLKHRCGGSQELDVHGFGVVLLQLLTGRRPGDIGLEPARNLVTWGLPRLRKNEVLKIVDYRLESNFPPVAVEKMAAVAASCLADEASSRPEMEKVLRDLQIASWETNNYYCHKHQQRAQLRTVGGGGAQT